MSATSRFTDSSRLRCNGGGDGWNNFQFTMDSLNYPDAPWDEIRKLPEGESYVQLAGFPERVRAKNFKTTGADGVVHLQHVYVDKSGHRAVLTRMAELMETTRSPASPLRERLAAMAEYHHLGISPHLFHRVNNSLLMAQINRLLHDAGLSGIAHGTLDYQALLYELPEYTTRFIQAVRENNPGCAALSDI